MSERVKIENRGGRREGSGRKPIGINKKRAVNIFLSPKVIEKLKVEKSRSKFVNQLLEKYYGISDEK